MFENKFVSLPLHLKTIEPMEVHRELRKMCNTETSKSDQNRPHDSTDFTDYQNMYVGFYSFYGYDNPISLWNY